MQSNKADARTCAHLQIHKAYVEHPQSCRVPAQTGAQAAAPTGVAAGDAMRIAAPSARPGRTGRGAAGSRRSRRPPGPRRPPAAGRIKFAAAGGGATAVPGASAAVSEPQPAGG